MSRTVAIDTSALMMPVESDVRLFDELDRLLGGYEPAVPAAVVAELECLEGGAAGTAAAVGAELARSCEVLETAEAGADDAMVALAAAGRVDAVVTNDQGLRDRVLDEDVPVIALRGRNKLAITRP